MTIESIIRGPASTLPITASCVEAARRMRRQNIGSVIIEQHGVPVGIVTDRDLALRVMAEELDPASVNVEAIMTKFPAFLSPERELGDAIATMREAGVRRLPVVNARGVVVGLVSFDDVLIALSDQLSQMKALLCSERDAQAVV